LGLDVESDEAQSLLCGRQQLAAAAAGVHDGELEEQVCLGTVPDCNQNLVNLFSGGTGDNYTTWGGQANNGSENTVYSYNDEFTSVKGAHTIKFGGMWQINHYNRLGRQCISGCVGFSYTETGKPAVTDPNQRAVRPCPLPRRFGLSSL